MLTFIGYRRAYVRNCKIDWSVEVELTAELRRALHPHVPDDLLIGRLRQPFVYEPPPPGRRSAKAVKRSTESRVHDKGSLVFAYRDEHFYLIEA